MCKYNNKVRVVGKKGRERERERERGRRGIDKDSFELKES